ncbi:uncharacterized protein LOC110950126 [Acanthochromis polyacanthus]|uniref:uncharacterized protein LOC110950126 n=1 Tax=Acanthochromis polyacanthus TaxID=80966 RepID=UPI002234B869|nr:uncharacterized protein LOC110950126 [Acanthochromis polyacanthus]
MNFRMRKEKKTWMVTLEKPEPDSGPLIVSKVKKSTRTMKSKEKIKETNSRSTSNKGPTTCETSGKILRLCVDLMSVLASAKEPVEEEETEEGNSCQSEKEAENSSKKEPSVCKSEEQKHDSGDSYLGLASRGTTETKPSVSPRFVLPPMTQLKAAPGCCECQKIKRSHTPLPPIVSCPQETHISGTVTTNDCRSDGAGREVSDSRPWIDNPLFSKSRSAEFRLPDISLSSLDALLQTVTQKLGRKRRGTDEALWRPVQSDSLLLAVREQHFRETSVRQQDGNVAKLGAVPEASAGGCRVNRQRLPPLFPAVKPPLILTMTKRNFLTSNTLQ